MGGGGGHGHCGDASINDDGDGCDDCGVDEGQGFEDGYDEENGYGDNACDDDGLGF